MPIVDLLIEILSALVKAMLPGSMLFLLAGLTIGVVFLLIGKGRRTAAVAWLAALAVFYWILSLPAVPRTLESWLGAGFGPLTTAAEADGARHVVVLTGGEVTLRSQDGSLDVPSTASAYRLLEAERLYRLLDQPILIVSGGSAGSGAEGRSESEAMKAQLVARGIPEDKIWTETESPDTHQQAILVADLLQREGIEDFVLVTSLAHMRRAVGAFVAEGLEPIPSSAEPEMSPSPAEPAWLPSAGALSQSEASFREMFALLYYRVRGWLG